MESLVLAELILINGDDLSLLRRNIINEDEIKCMNTKALISNSSFMFCINEKIMEGLELTVVERKKFGMASGTIEEYEIVAPVEIRFKNRRTSCQAIVLPGDSQPLLGKTALEEMDLIIHPQKNELIVNPDHPFFAQVKIKRDSY